MKKLTLTKETIRDLSNAELTAVAGGGTLLLTCNNTCGCTLTASISHPGCICGGGDSICVCS